MRGFGTAVAEALPPGMPVAAVTTALPGPAADNNNDGTLAMPIAILPRPARHPSPPAAAVPGAVLPLPYRSQRVPR